MAHTCGHPESDVPDGTFGDETDTIGQSAELVREGWLAALPVNSEGGTRFGTHEVGSESE